MIMLRLSAICAIVVALVGCVHEEEPDTGPRPAAVVKMSDFRYTPKSVEVLSGDTVEWVNTSVLSWHTATCDPAIAKNKADVELPEGAQPFNSGRLNPGARFRYTFWTPGTYRYFCIPHEKLGMVGEVVVKPR